MKLKSLLLLLIFALIHQTGRTQTEHAAINEAWIKLNKAYLLRNESIMNITDTLRKRGAISDKAYRDLSKQIRQFSLLLRSTGSLNRKRIAEFEDRNKKLTKAFGKLILKAGSKAPDHYYLDQLEGLENRLHLYKSMFNEACADKGQKVLMLPIKPAPKIKF